MCAQVSGNRKKNSLVHATDLQTTGMHDSLELLPRKSRAESNPRGGTVKKQPYPHESRLRELEQTLAFNQELHQLESRAEEIEAKNVEQEVRDRVHDIPPLRPATPEEILSYADEVKRFTDSSPQRMQEIRDRLASETTEDAVRRRLNLPTRKDSD